MNWTVEFETLSRVMSASQAPLVRQLQEFLDQLEAEETFGVHAVNAAIATRVNQTATRYGLEVQCWDEKSGSWRAAKLKCINPKRDAQAPGYFQAVPPGRTSESLYCGRRWPKLRAAAQKNESADKLSRPFKRS
jgi:hypothetical protein